MYFFQLRRMTAAELLDVYDGTLRHIADAHAPASTSVRRIRRLSPWFDDESRQARQKSQLFERRYRRRSCRMGRSDASDACLVPTEGKHLLDSLHCQQRGKFEETVAIVV